MRTFATLTLSGLYALAYFVALDYVRPHTPPTLWFILIAFWLAIGGAVCVRELPPSPNRRQKYCVLIAYLLLGVALFLGDPFVHPKLLQRGWGGAPTVALVLFWCWTLGCVWLLRNRTKKDNSAQSVGPPTGV